LALAVFTGMVAVFPAEQRPLSRQFARPFSPEYPILVSRDNFVLFKISQSHFSFQERGGFYFANIIIGIDYVQK